MLLKAFADKKMFFTFRHPCKFEKSEKQICDYLILKVQIKFFRKKSQKIVHYIHRTDSVLHLEK